MTKENTGLSPGDLTEEFAQTVADIIFNRLFTRALGYPESGLQPSESNVTGEPNEFINDANKYLTAHELAKTLHTTVETIYRNPARFPKIKNGRLNLYHLPTILKNLTPKPPHKNGYIYTHKIGKTRAIASPKNHTRQPKNKPSIKPTTQPPES